MSSSVKADSYRLFISVSSPTAICSSNSSRDSLVINNESGVLYVKLGSNASPSDYTFRLTSRTVLELPHYLGIVSAVKETAPGYIQVTEII